MFLGTSSPTIITPVPRLSNERRGIAALVTLRCHAVGLHIVVVISRLLSVTASFRNYIALSAPPASFCGPARSPQFSTLIFFCSIEDKRWVLHCWAALPVAPNGSSPVRLRLPSAIRVGLMQCIKGVGIARGFLLTPLCHRQKLTQVQLRLSFGRRSLGHFALRSLPPWFSLF